MHFDIDAELFSADNDNSYLLLLHATKTTPPNRSMCVIQVVMKEYYLEDVPSQKKDMCQVLYVYVSPKQLFEDAKETFSNDVFNKVWKTSSTSSSSYPIRVATIKAGNDAAQTIEQKYWMGKYYNFIRSMYKMAKQELLVICKNN